MKTRIITAIVALAVFAAVLIAPPIVFTIALAAVILFMLYECYSATKADAAMKLTGFVSAVLLLAAMYMVVKAFSDSFIIVYIAATLIVLIHMTLIVFKHGKRNYKDILSNGFLTLYITVSMWCIWFTKEFFGISLMLLIFICAWSCDTFAYFSGRLFGKHKLIPHVSPNKTVEGSIGGVIGAIICCLIYLFILCKIPTIDFIVRINHWILGFAVIGLVGGIFSQIGDLIASSIKRDEDIKDFGWIFPGHGGFMDRFDSVMFIAPIILILMIGSLFLG